MPLLPIGPTSSGVATLDIHRLPYGPYTLDEVVGDWLPPQGSPRPD